LPAALSNDGVHPLPAGYAMMAPLAQAGIVKALK
jgi:lysophospholipase L1-like esterase